MALNYSQFLPDDPELAYTATGIKFQSTVTGPFNSTDIYQDKSIAELRAESIGCSGTRQVLVSSIGSYEYAPCTDYQTYKQIMMQMPVTEPIRRYYASDPTENIYDIRDSVNDQVHEGFDYKDVILERTLSKVLYRDPVKSSILQTFNRVVLGLIESVKQIKNHFNYTVPSNNKRVF
jgi:hypothetical protein